MIRFFCKSYLKHKWMHDAKVFCPSLTRLYELGHLGVAISETQAIEFSKILQGVRVEGVWKWTAAGRLRAMDDLLLKWLSAKGVKSIRMLDVGASDGITSLDTFNRMAGSDIDVTMSVLDRTTRLYAIKMAAGVLYCTSRKKPVLLRLGRLGLCLEAMEGFEGVVWNWLAHIVSDRLEMALSSNDLSGENIVSLVHPSVTENNAIEVVEGDLFNANSAWSGRFDVVRASNVLNRSYFSAAKIEEALSVLHGYLKDGGLLLVSRNEIDTSAVMELGAMWRKDSAGFSHVDSLKCKPEIFSIVEQFKVRLK